MRKVIETQKQFGQTNIEDINFDLQSRDEITKLLIGLQAIYCNAIVRNKVFDLLLKLVPEKVDSGNGRPGMDLWVVFVLGMLRLCCNIDYDKIKCMNWPIIIKI